MDLLGVLEEARPVLLLEFLLVELELNVLAGVVNLGPLGVDLGEELNVELVGLLQGLGVALEGESLGLQVQLEVGRGDVRDGDGEPDEVLLGVRGAGALSPEDCRARAKSVSCS